MNVASRPSFTLESCTMRIVELNFHDYLSNFLYRTIGQIAFLILIDEFIPLSAVFFFHGVAQCRINIMKMFE